MIAWPAKDPNDTADFTWTPALDAGDAITSFTATIASGTATAESYANTGTTGTVWIAGGVAGEAAIVTLLVVTDGGRTFEESAVIPIVERGDSLLAEFRLRFPAFAAVSDGPISYWLAQATADVGDNWPASIQTNARLSYAAHRLAENSALPSAIPMGVTSFKSGTFSATVADSVASAVGFETTAYGQEFLRLRRIAFAGPRLAWTPPAA